MNKIDGFIIDLPVWQQEIVEHLRFIILQTAPGIVESFKYKCPYYEYKKQLCYIYPRKNEVVLGFVQGKLLAKTNPILTGEQKQVRHVIISKITKKLDEQIRFVLQEAILLNDELYEISKGKWK